MRMWQVSTHGAIAAKSVRVLPYPTGKSAFVTALMYSTRAQLYFCACMDGRLRLYKHGLRIKASLAWAERAVYCMRFVDARDELIVAGASGVKVCFALVECDSHLCSHLSANSSHARSMQWIAPAMLWTSGHSKAQRGTVRPSNTDALSTFLRRYTTRSQTTKHICARQKTQTTLWHISKASPTPGLTVSAKPFTSA
jgi:hypothetical protein